MSELKAYTYDDMLDGTADVDVEYYSKAEADKVIAEYQEKILVLEKSYKKLVKMYDELSNKSDKAYRHANRLRRIFRKLSHEEK